MVPGGGNDRALPKGNTVETGGGNAGGDNPQMKLTAEEGALSIEVPPDAKAGAETVVKVAVTAADKYKVNIEFPSKLSLTTTNGVTIAKADFKAGGHDKSKGDAEVFDDHQLQFLVKLTPADRGNFTINGSFKFAVCDKAGSQCLPKKMPIAIQVAAK
jgi:hypothetical protein